MRVGIIIGRFGDVDGVALETEKWIKILQEMGHEIYMLSGQCRKSLLGDAYETLIPNMSFFSPNCDRPEMTQFETPLLNMPFH